MRQDSKTHGEDVHLGCWRNTVRELIEKESGKERDKSAGIWFTLRGSPVWIDLDPGVSGWNFDQFISGNPLIHGD